MSACKFGANHCIALEFSLSVGESMIPLDAQLFRECCRIFSDDAEQMLEQQADSSDRNFRVVVEASA